MEKIVTIEEKEIGLKCTAGTVRAYRMDFNRDLILDFATVEKKLLKDKDLDKEFQNIAENILWMMAKEYDSSIPEINVWLEQFSPYFVFRAIAHAINMWHENLVTLNNAKKN